MKIKTIQFEADRNIGAKVVASVFPSLPLKGQEGAWDDAESAEAYCRGYPRERMDVGGFYRPEFFTPPPQDTLEDWEGVVGILTAAQSRLVTFYPPNKFWTVDFGASLYAASQLLVALDDHGIEPSAIVCW